MPAIDHLVIIGLPKSANVFFSRAMEATLGCVPIQFCSRANMAQQILPEKLAEFLSSIRAVGGQHLPPTRYNLALLQAVNVTHIALLFRDPRDALISWWRHLERSDIRECRWIAAALYAAGLQRQDYYELSAEDKLIDLAEKMFPAMQRWMSDWLEVVDGGRSPFRFEINVYERFATDPAAAVRRVLRFFGHVEEPVLPKLEGELDSGIRVETHYRRGLVGAYRDEAPPDIATLLDRRLNRALARRFGWALP
jgi:hypothetical protein